MILLITALLAIASCSSLFNLNRIPYILNEGFMKLTKSSPELHSQYVNDVFFRYEDVFGIYVTTNCKFKCDIILDEKAIAKVLNTARSIETAVKAESDILSHCLMSYITFNYFRKKLELMSSSNCKSSNLEVSNDHDGSLDILDYINALHRMVIGIHVFERESPKMAREMTSEMQSFYSLISLMILVGHESGLLEVEKVLNLYQIAEMSFERDLPLVYAAAVRIHSIPRRIIEQPIWSAPKQYNCPLDLLSAKDLDDISNGASWREVLKCHLLEVQVKSDPSVEEPKMSIRAVIQSLATRLLTNIPNSDRVHIRSDGLLAVNITKLISFSPNRKLDFIISKSLKFAHKLARRAMRFGLHGRMYGQLMLALILSLKHDTPSEDSQECLSKIDLEHLHQYACQNDNPILRKKWIALSNAIIVGSQSN